MKNLHKKAVLICLILAGLTVPAFNLPTFGQSSPPTISVVTQVETGYRQRPTGAIPYRTVYSDPHISGNYLVWSQQDRSLDSGKDDLFDSAHIGGVNLATHTPLVFSTDRGNQSEPSISGSIVVWEDSAHSCPTCERDILGKDLTTGTSYQIAIGPVDQLRPAIAGNQVAWVQHDDQVVQLLSKDLLTNKISTIATFPSNTRTTISRPVMSEEYLVWSETVSPETPNPSTDSGLVQLVPTSTLRAYNLTTGLMTTLWKAKRSNVQYAVADHRVVWSVDQLHFADLATGESTVLTSNYVLGPAISGDTVTWSAGSGDGEHLDLWGLKLTTRTPVLLVTGDSNKTAAVIANNQLVWQNDGGANDGQITTTSLSAALAAPRPSPKQQARPPYPTLAKGTTGPSNPASTRPLIKGMHAANGSWWNHAAPYQTASLDALVNTSQNTPYFGAVVVLQGDLDAYTTGYAYNPGNPMWGDRVGYAMRTLSNDGVQVIVRTFTANPIEPGKQLRPYHTNDVSPDLISQNVINNLAWRTWMKRIQIENEPDLEWGSCSNGCGWPNSPMPSYIWLDNSDPTFYKAVNDFYTQARQNIVLWQALNCPTPQTSPTCANLAYNITIWTPPLAGGFYQGMSDNHNRYEPLAGMVNNFTCGSSDPNHKCFSYHEYPCPATECSDHFLSGIHNNAYDWLSGNIQSNIQSGYYRSEITEFGWDPSKMGPYNSADPFDTPGCNYTQESRWQALHIQKYTCNTTDGVDHLFENDIAFFDANYRYKAETVAVWTTTAGLSRADGLTPSGVQKRWFNNYQQSSPPP